MATKIKKYKVTAKTLNIRKSYSLNSDILGVLKGDETVAVSMKRGNFGKLADRPGWVCLDFVSEV